MNWLILILAGLVECVWTIGLKYSEGFSRFWPSLITFVALVLSFLMLSYAMKTLPVGTAYAVWTGIGAVGTVILGIILFHEPATIPRLLCVTLIICGIIGLKFC